MTQKDVAATAGCVCDAAKCKLRFAETRALGHRMFFGRPESYTCLVADGNRLKVERQYACPSALQRSRQKMSTSRDRRLDEGIHTSMDRNEPQPSQPKLC